MKSIYLSNDISVVVDNNVLIDLDEIGRLDLLFRLFNPVIIPNEVYKSEIYDALKEKLQEYPFILGNIETEIGYQAFSVLTNDPRFRQLSTYDRITIAIAKENCYYCNSNDLPIRKACDYLGVQYIGILGILGRACIKSTLTFDQVHELAQRLLSEATTCYIKPNIVKEFEEELITCIEERK